MRPINLSVRLPIVDLVSRYLTNYLIGREPILQRIAPLVPRRCLLGTLCGISSRFQLLSPSVRQVAHALLARPPLTWQKQAPVKSVRLACVRHAASVRPEPGSNSLKYCIYHLAVYKSILEHFSAHSLTMLAHCLSLFTLSLLLEFSGPLLHRCLIFKVRFLPHSSECQIIIPNSNPFVNTFFRFFETFFENFSFMCFLDYLHIVFVNNCWIF